MNVVGNVVLGHGVRHGHCGAFAHRVSKTVGKRGGPGDGSHIQNHSSPVFLHMPDAHVNAVVDALHIDARKTRLKSSSVVLSTVPI